MARLIVKVTLKQLLETTSQMLEIGRSTSSFFTRVQYFRKSFPAALHNVPLSSGRKEAQNESTVHPHEETSAHKNNTDEDIEKAFYKNKSVREQMIDELNIFTRNSSESSSDELNKNSSESSSDESPDVKASFLAKEDNKENWQGGKANGSVKRQKGKLSVKYGVEEIISVNIKDFANLEKAIEAANTKLFEYCRDNGLLENSYKVLEDDLGKYVTVQAGNQQFACDFEDLALVEKYVWKVHKTLLTVYSTSAGKKTVFHDLLMNSKQVAFIDRNKLNLRRKNLIKK